MRIAKSHGRLVMIMAIISGPVGLGFGGGIWLSRQFQNVSSQAEETNHFRQVTSQGKLLIQLLNSEIQTLQLQAIQLFQKQEAPKGNLLYWAQLDISNPQAIQFKQSKRNPVWNANSSSEDGYLQIAMKNIRPALIKEKGIDVLRIKKDVTGEGEWLGLIFPISQLESSVLLLLIDPATVFNAIQQWPSHSDGGRSRSYLIASDGRVISHSQKSWISTNLSEQLFYKDTLKKVFSGEIAGGAGEFQSLDQLQVRSAYFPLDKLPFVAVVEEVNSQQFAKWDEMKVITESLILLSILFFTLLACAFFLSHYLVKVVTLTVQSEVSDSAADPEHSVTNGAGAIASPGILASQKSKDRFFSKEDFLLLDPVHHPEDNNPQ